MYMGVYKIIIINPSVFFVALRPNAGHDFLILEVF